MCRYSLPLQERSILVGLPLPASTSGILSSKDIHRYWAHKFPSSSSSAAFAFPLPSPSQKEEKKEVPTGEHLALTTSNFTSFLLLFHMVTRELYHLWKKFVGHPLRSPKLHPHHVVDSCYFHYQLEEISDFDDDDDDD